MVKFQINFVIVMDKYDICMLFGIFKFIICFQVEDEVYQQVYEVWVCDLDYIFKLLQMMNYDFYLLQDGKMGERFWEKFDVDNLDKEKELLYIVIDGEGRGIFKFLRVRVYEMVMEKEMDYYMKYVEEVIFVYWNDEMGSKGWRDDSVQKGVYYYFVMQRIMIWNQRMKNIVRMIGVLLQGEEEEVRVGELEVMVGELSEELRQELERFKSMFVGYFGGEDEEEEEEE